MASKSADAYVGLKNNRIKDRQEALQNLQTAFANDAVVESFSQNASNWPKLFSHMFEAIAIEKRDTKANALKRFEDTAKVLRWLVERSLKYLNTKALDALHRHIFSTLGTKELCTPVALDYLKILKYLASYPPHLEHLTADTWIEYAALCFNVILDDPLGTDLLEIDDQDNQADMHDSDDTTDSNNRKRRKIDRGSAPPRQTQSKTTRRRQISVSQEQVECSALLAIIFRSPNNPICIAKNPTLAEGILQKLQRILLKYPSESSILHDYLTVVALTLQHAGLNRVREVRSFALSTWEGYVGLWGLKERRLKEQLVVVLRHLFLYVLVDEPAFSDTSIGSFNIVEALTMLWSALDGEAQDRWGTNGLNMPALRLEISLPEPIYTGESAEKPFIANTFRAGWNFDPDQALSWAILELQATCARELFKLSESMHPPTPSAPRADKRIKLQNPVTAILESIDPGSASNVRNYYLQVLLFFIDQHWSVVHDAMKRKILEGLRPLVSLDDAEVQSWAFLNLAAIAFGEKHWADVNVSLLSSSQCPNVMDADDWDPFWNHAVRRATVPQVCRAACHLAHSLLIALYRFTPPSGHIFLSSSRVLVDIEAFGKDMDVQGPHAPYDSVCCFLDRCLKIASQDVRLYRMNLEEKVLNWLMDSWVITGAGKGLPLSHSINDVLMLLETISGIHKRSDLVLRPSLLSSPVVDSMKMERRVRVIRDFLLFAKLPSYASPKEPPVTQYTQHDLPLDPMPLANDSPAPSRNRERRISAYFQRMLDALSLEWGTRLTGKMPPNVEVAKRTLDFAIIAIVYEATLAMNSTLPTKRVMQAAGKLLVSVFSVAKSSRWTPEEKMTLTSALEPLVWRSQVDGEPAWEALTAPDFSHDGINRDELDSLPGLRTSDFSSSVRGSVLQAIWQNNDIYDSLTQLSNLFRLEIEEACEESDIQLMDIDDGDGFGPVKSSVSQGSIFSSEKLTLLRRNVDLRLLFLIRGPMLHSISGEMTRDRLLVDKLIDSAENHEWFSMILPIIVREIELGTLEFTSAQLKELFVIVSENIRTYDESRSRDMIVLTLRLLLSTIHLWPTPVGHDIFKYVQKLNEWAATKMMKGSLSWEVRDAYAQFLQRFLITDPNRDLFKQGQGRQNTHQVLVVLSNFAKDDDVHVRFRAAVTIPLLFRNGEGNLLELYNEIRKSFSSKIDDYEQMATRFLSLANIMVVSSSVRRGPYWHLLETCHHSSNYSTHIEAVLKATVERLGMPSLSSLFHAYSFQLAHGMVTKKDCDFLSFPPKLLGYRERTKCAEAAFRVFVPVYLVLRAWPQYENHCKVLQKQTADGIQEYFGDIVGFFVATYLDTRPDALDGEIEEELQEILQMEGDLVPDIQLHGDSVVAATLRTLGDQDCGTNGSIAKALQQDQQLGPKVTQVFQLLTRYRNLQRFAVHKPNVPCFGTSTILRALSWIFRTVPKVDTKATVYHVIHQIFSHIQDTPLVNEKFRLLNSLCLWIAYRHEYFNDATLLHTLLHGTSCLLSQPSLARAAQSILEWTFRNYRKLRTADTRLSRVLVRVSSICYDYANRTRDPALRELGTDLLSWIDEQTASLGAVPILLPLVQKALPVWPRDPSEKLAAMQKKVSVSDISAILQDDHIASNKFRVVRRLKDESLQGEVEFANREFWRLKEALPLARRLQEEDMAAFIDLLISKHGQIDSLNAELPALNTICTRHRRLYKNLEKERNEKEREKGRSKGNKDKEKERLEKKKNMEEEMDIARDAVIYGLMGLLQHESPSLVHNAYNTLRLMMSVLPSSNSSFQVWSPEFKAEAEFLQYYNRQPMLRPARKLSILLESEHYIELSAKFSDWITHLSLLISDILAVRYSVYGQLYSILSNNIATAEEMFPVLVYALLQAEQQAEFSSRESPKAVITAYLTKVLEFPNASITCLKSIVDVILHLRYFTPQTAQDKKDKRVNNNWLGISYQLLARSAVRCGAYTTALLFLELVQDSEPRIMLDKAVAEEIQYEIYAHIDEPDGFYGIRTENLHRFLLERLRHEQQWDKAFRFHGAGLEAGKGSMESDSVEGVVQSFHSFGFNRLAIDTLQASGTKAERHKGNSSSLNYQLGWRSETWDLPDSDAYTTGAPLYHALRCVHRERDLTAVDQHVHSALYREMDMLRSLGTESVRQIREVLQALMCLSQIVRWKSGPLQQDIQSKAIDVDKWSEFLTISNNFSFSDLENIMSVRISLIGSCRQAEEKLQIGTMLSPFLKQLVQLEKDCLLSLSRAARKAGQKQIALNSVLRARNLDSTQSFEVSREYANVLWSLKEEKVAVNFLNELVKECESTGVSATSRAKLYSKLGTWTSEAFLEKPTDIWEKYFDPAIKSLIQDSSCSASERAAVYHQCAIFADKQYHAILRSPDALRWKVYVERKKKEIQERNIEIQELQSRRDVQRLHDVSRAQKDAEKLLKADSEHYRRHNSSLNAFLRQALVMYSRCLEMTEDFDTDASIKFCSLWFANFDDDIIGDTVRKVMDSIPSRKFVFLAHQLSARITHSDHNSKSQEDLQRLILRLCREHPFHSVYQVYCLQADKVQIGASTDRRLSGRHSLSQLTQTTPSQDERCAAAKDVLEQLREDDFIGSKIRDIESCCEGYLQWAKLAISKDGRYDKRTQPSPFKIPRDMRILGLKRLKVPVLTADTPIDPTMQYLDCVWIEKYSDTFDTAGGVNLPKITTCFGSDGVKYKQLFKGEGKDDMRQDAVMEQVFELVNKVLDQDRETSRRSLRIRSYKVVPLGTQAGVLEFVGNTSPLREWLQNGHTTYEPTDMKPAEAGSKLKAVSTKSPEQRLKAYLEVIPKFKPVFRHFFTEKHRNPVLWFSTRLRYTRSVATNSIVGHILGLGDRHTSNILMDNSTGEVIHIDLGIAFDQGKLLPIPELVPFRLTRDVVDGMGTSGTQGVFQRCAEETLRVLRDGSDIIMTVLEVFKHDPLHSWTASEIKIRRVQDAPPQTPVSETNAARTVDLGIGIDMTSGTAQESADRALSSVARKLDKSLSVESTVNELIADATDVTKLGQIYCGWAPHM